MSSQSEAELLLLLKLQDDASPGLEQAGQNAGGIGGVFGALAGPVGIASAAIGVLGGGLIAATKAAADEQVGVERLNATLQTAVPNWDGNTASIDAAIVSAQNKAFADDAARDSLNTLLLATHDVEKATADQALAMDIARAKNIDLQTASDLVAKAEMGKLSVLKQLGVTVDENTTKEEAFAQLQGQVAGQADAYAGTAAGSMERIQGAFGNAVEDIGGVLLPKVTEALGGVAEFLASPEFQAGFELAVDLIGNGLGTAFDLVSTAVQFLMPIFQGIADLVGGFLGLLQSNGNALDPVTEGLGTLAGLITSTVGPVLETVFGELSRFWTEIEPKLLEVWANIQSAIDTVWPIIQNVIVFGLQTVQELWNNVWPGIQQVLSGVWQVIQGVVQVAWGVVSGIISAGLSLLSGDWSGAWTAIQTALGTVWDGIQLILSGAWQLIQGLFSVALGEIQTLWDTAWGLVGSTLSSTWDSIVTTVQTKVGEIISFLTGVPAQVVETAKSIGTGLLDGIKQGIEDAWASVTGLISDLASNLPGPIKDALGIHSPSEEMAEQVGEPVPGGVLVGAQRAWPTLLTGMGALAQQLIEMWRQEFDPANEGGIGFVWRYGWELAREYLRNEWSVKTLEILRISLADIRVLVTQQMPLIEGPWVSGLGAMGNAMNSLAGTVESDVDRILAALAKLPASLPDYGSSTDGFGTENRALRAAGLGGG